MGIQSRYTAAWIWLVNHHRIKILTLKTASIHIALIAYYKVGTSRCAHNASNVSQKHWQQMSELFKKAQVRGNSSFDEDKDF